MTAETGPIIYIIHEPDNYEVWLRGDVRHTHQQRRTFVRSFVDYPRALHFSERLADLVHGVIQDRRVRNGILRSLDQ